MNSKEYVAPMSMWHHYNVHYYDSRNIRQKMCITALSRDDAKGAFEGSIKNPGSNYANCVFIKAVKLNPTPATPMQKLAQQYRACIGASCMAASNINRLHNPFELTDAAKATKFGLAKELALKQCSKLQRDIKDMFIRAGLNIK